MSAAGLAWVDPATALTVVLPALGVVVRQGEIEARFAAVEGPPSLLTLVKVADALGVTARAFRGDRARLADVPLPAILHVGNPLDEADQGFLVLWERRPNGFLVGGGGARFELRPDELDRLWTGVVATVVGKDARDDRDEDAETPAALRPKPRSHRLLPVAVGVLIGAVAFATSAPGERGAALGLLAWLVIVALGAEAAIALLLRAPVAQAGDEGTCRGERPCGGAGGWFACDSVLATRWAAPLGVDVGALAVAFFAAALAVLAIAAALPGPARAPGLAWLALVHFAAVPVSLFYIALQAFLRRYCALCLAAHAAILTGVAAGLLVAPPFASIPARAFVPFAFGHALAFLAARAVVVPYLAAIAETRSTRARLAAIDATSAGAIAELLGRAPVAPPPPESPFHLGDRAAGLRLDVLVDPACSACHGVVAALERLVDTHAELVHAYVHLPTREPRDPADRELRVAVTAAASVAAFAAARDRGAELLAAAAVGATGALSVLGAPANADVAAARAAQAAADPVADATLRITPTILVGGRLWARSLWELDLVLASQPDQLRPLASVAWD